MACCGDMPTLETLAAVDLLREHAPRLADTRRQRGRPDRLQPETEHPHGLPDAEFDGLFTADRPVIFAFHGYPALIHRLTYRRTNHDNFHVHGYKEEGTTTTPFDMTVLNELDRCHLALTALDRTPGSTTAPANCANCCTTNSATIADTSKSTVRTCPRSRTGGGARGQLSRVVREPRLAHRQADDARRPGRSEGG